MHPMLTTDWPCVDPAYEKFRGILCPSKLLPRLSPGMFKLTHRDMGPKVRYVGTEVPAEDLIWQDPVPAPSYNQTRPTSKPSKRSCCKQASARILTAWASASSFRSTDKRGGANGAGTFGATKIGKPTIQAAR